MTDSTKLKGSVGEDAATDYLARKGYRIIERNYHARCGEIDIIAENDRYLVFVEVKARHFDAIVQGAQAVDYKKQQKIVKTAQRYIDLHPTDKEIRFDVAEIELAGRINIFANAVRYYEDAFDATGYDLY